MFRAAARLIRWTGHLKGRLYVGFVYSFFASIFTAMPIVVAAFVLNEMINDFRGVAPLRPRFALPALAAIGILVLLRFLFSYLRARSQDSVATEITAEKRIAVGDVLKRVPLGYIAKHHTGDISAVITTELSFVELIGMSMIDKVVNGYINVAVMVIFLAVFSWPIALISLAGVLGSTLFLFLLKRTSDKGSPLLYKSVEEMAGAVIEYVRGMSVVKAFGRTGPAMEAVNRACTENMRLNINFQRRVTPVQSLHKLCLKAASVGIVLVSAILAMRAEMPAPYMLMMLTFSFAIFGQVEPVGDSSYVLGMVGSILNNLEELQEAEFIDADGTDIDLTNYDISFRNVSFAYEEHDVIRNVSFDIPEGSTTAVVGPSGSGKTTLCNLLARFYDVREGAISVGGHDVREFTCDSLLSHVSMVFQNVYLFHDTVKTNIGFGRPDATMEEIIEAAKQARCHDFIMELPDGYDTVIGEGGSSLSGGEKQRISIARALLKNAPIILLDEATASIDPENEHLIQAALGELTVGKTTIVIAHRLATIEHADQILVLEEGRLVQSGTHEELVSQEGLYKRFVNIREEAEGWNL